MSCRLGEGRWCVLGKRRNGVWIADLLVLVIGLHYALQ